MLCLVVSKTQAGKKATGLFRALQYQIQPTANQEGGGGGPASLPETNDGRPSMKILLLARVAAGLAVLIYFGHSFSAAAQSIIAPEQPANAAAHVPVPILAPVPPPAHATAPAAKPLGTGPAHAYLLRGLMNIFSLGMDDLAQKIERAGVASSVHEHGEWQRLSDEIAARYKAGNHGPIILIGHSLGADAVMLMGEYLGTKGVPVALIVPFDGTRSLNASANVARVMNITQRDYAYMRRGYGFRGELANVDVSRDESIGHISIDKSARLHAMVVNKIVSVVGKGGGAGQVASPASATLPPSSKPVFGSPNSSPLKQEPLAGTSAKLESMPPVMHTPLSPHTASDSGPGGAVAVRGPVSTGPAASPSIPLEYQRLGQ
jgi:hypothetical protein